MSASASKNDDIDVEHSVDHGDEMEDDGDGDVADKVEQIEVRMDLTDDLLHMVCTFVVVTVFSSSPFLSGIMHC